MERGAYKLYINEKTSRDRTVDFLSEENAKKVRNFHSSFKEYKPTPLVELKNLAQYLGVKNISIKDESHRFGLNAFKVLGGSYAIGRYIGKTLGIPIEELTAERLLSKDVKKSLGDLTFVTATDGNHGRGVAWTARELSQKCLVLMPEGTALERRDNIRALGARCEIMEGMNYDACVRYASDYAKYHGAIMVQDTSWPGYEEIPAWIMEGYTTMGLEAKDQMEEAGFRPSHIFLQAGVGSLAASLSGYFASAYGDDKPLFTVVESEKAACIYDTMKAEDGKIHIVDGKLDTIMAGLACGEPVSLGLPIFKDLVEGFLTMADEGAARGMRILGNPLRGDERIISGESGASTLGALSQILEEENLKDIKKALKLDENSVILLFSTEGDTDFENYREIVWDGLYPNL